MRVLLVTDWYPTTPDDPAGSFVRAQAVAVAARHEVAVIQADGRAGPLYESVEDGVRVVRPTGRASRLPATLVNTRAVLTAAARGGSAPEIVHAHGFSAGLAGLALARARGVPLVVSEHASVFATGEVGSGGSRVARLVFAAADLVCPVSISQRETLAAAGYRGPFRVVPNPVDIGLFKPGGEPPARPRAVVVGSLRGVKGTADLVEALGLLAGAGRDFSVEIVGDGPLRASLEARADALGLRNRVSFLGSLAAPDVADRLRAASFAIVPSRWETFSVALTEAFACGLPVVATTVGGLPERVHDGNGILCAPADPPALASAIERMLDDMDSFDREAIADQARATFAPSVVAAEWDEIYEQLRGSRGRRRRQPRTRS